MVAVLAVLSGRCLPSKGDHSRGVQRSAAETWRDLFQSELAFGGSTCVKQEEGGQACPPRHRQTPPRRPTS